MKLEKACICYTSSDGGLTKSDNRPLLIRLIGPRIALLHSISHRFFLFFPRACNVSKNCGSVRHEYIMRSTSYAFLALTLVLAFKSLSDAHNITVRISALFHQFKEIQNPHSAEESMSNVQLIWEILAHVDILATFWESTLLRVLTHNG